MRDCFQRLWIAGEYSNFARGLPIMIYDLSLRTVAYIAGMALIVFSLPGLFLPAPIQNWFKRFPRSGIAGVVLLTIALVWSFWLLATMEMGEFSSFRKPLLIIL